MLSSGCDVCEYRVLLPKEVRIGERATCPSLGSPDGVAPDSEAHHVSSGGGVPTDLASECGIAYKNKAAYKLVQWWLLRICSLLYSWTSPWENNMSIEFWCFLLWRLEGLWSWFPLERRHYSVRTRLAGLSTMFLVEVVSIQWPQLLELHWDFFWSGPQIQLKCIQCGEEVWGMDSSSSGSCQGPSNSPTLKLKRKHPQEWLPSSRRFLPIKISPLLIWSCMLEINDDFCCQWFLANSSNHVSILYLYQPLVSLHLFSYWFILIEATEILEGVFLLFFNIFGKHFCLNLTFDDTGICC